MDEGQCSEDDESIYSDEDQQPKQIRSKVTKTVNRQTKDQGDRFSHLRNDPEFKKFLNEMIDERKGKISSDLEEDSSKHKRKGSSK